MGKRHTLVHRIADWAERRPTRPALHARADDGSWRTLSWAEYWQAVREVAKGLIALGHEPGQCVAMVGSNRPEWVQLQFGIQAAGGIPAPIYPTTTVAQAGYIVRNAQARIACCDDVEQLEKFRQAEQEGHAEPLTHVISMRALDAEAVGDDDRVRTLEALRSLGAEQPDDALDARLDALDGEQTCLLIYTSGTTGLPKGVELSHGGQIVVGEGLLATNPAFAEEGRYRAVSYLPLSHQAEQTVTNVVHLEVGGEITFCADMAALKEHLLHARPSIFLGVPRVWEKFEAALRSKLAEATGLKATLAGWARRTELACFEADVERGVPASPLRRRVARALVVDKIKDALGLDQLEVAVTGAAPINVSTQEFFASLGIPILEAYGMTETHGVATFTDHRKPRFGTVGKPLAGVEARIAEEGEIQLRGRNMTRGYYRLPEESEKLFTDDGWLRTGDLGSMDEEGNVRITGRLKELIITAGGKNVAPVEVEHYLQAIEGVGQAVVVGDRMPFLSALITLDPEGLDALGAKLGIEARDLETLSGHPEVRRYLEERIDRDCNAHLARYQTVKKFEVLPVEFTVEGGELTPTMKTRRNVVAEKYADVIDGFYAHGSAASERRASA